MLGLISFTFKLLAASIIGGALSYIPNDDKLNFKIIQTSLICILSSAILGLCIQLSNYNSSNTIGFGLLCIVIMIVYLSKDKIFLERITWYFAGIIGAVIGAGYIIQASILSLLVYMIFNNNKKIINYINNEKIKSEDGIVENISN